MSTTTMSPESIQARLDEMAEEYKRAPQEIARVMHQTFWEMFPIRTGFGGHLFVCETQGEFAWLSQDGGMFSTDVWHEGPETGESVYGERWNTATGNRTWHGYVDPTSRKVVQVG